MSLDDFLDLRKYGACRYAGSEKGLASLVGLPRRGADGTLLRRGIENDGPINGTMIATGNAAEFNYGGLAPFDLEMLPRAVREPRLMAGPDMRPVRYPFATSFDHSFDRSAYNLSIRGS